MEHGLLGKIQSEGSEIGHTLLVLAHFNLDQLHKDLGEGVMKIGRDLHLVETMRVTMDGGVSTRRILEQITNSRNLLDMYVRYIAE